MASVVAWSQVIGILLMISANIVTSLHAKGSHNKNKKPEWSPNQLLSVQDLHKLIDKPDFDKKYRLVEASLETKNENEFKKEHIPKAIYFDAMRGAQPTKICPINFPEAEPFREYLNSLGISNSNHIIIYDRVDKGMFDSARLWWVFKIYGHNKLSILNGGLRHWKEKNFTLTNQTKTHSPTDFTLRFQRDKIRNFTNVYDNVKSKKELLVDAREEEDFLQGHIPNAINLPLNQFFINGTNRLMSPKEMRKFFSLKKINPNQPIIVSCRKGLRAAILGYVAHLIGMKKVALYPGSWMEYSHKLEMMASESSNDSSSTKPARN